MQSQPKQGLQTNNLDQPTGLGIKATQGGMSIYEKAAMQANPFSAPDAQEQDDGSRVPCPTCGRNFREAALEKHEKICKKVFVQKRKAFDVKEMRKADGLDQLEQEQKYNKPYQPKKKEEPAKAGGKIPKWKL